MVEELCAAEVDSHADKPASVMVGMLRGGCARMNSDGADRPREESSGDDLLRNVKHSKF